MSEDIMAGQAPMAVTEHIPSPHPLHLQATITSANYRYPCWISDDGRVLYSNDSTWLRQSQDDGTSWTEIHHFDHSVSAVRTTGDGELLVCLNDTSDTEPGSIWKSIGYRADNPTDTAWKRVLTLSAVHVYVHNAWGISCWKNIAFAAEYGSKTADVNARRAYLSVDYGHTWRMVFDLGGRQGSHCHGVCFDPYAKRLWLSTGDFPYGCIRYSDNRGATWQTVDSEGRYFQPTSIFALENCLLLGSDSRANGVLRIRRTNRLTQPRVEIVHRVEDDSRLKVVGHLIHRRPLENGTIYIPFASAVEDGRAIIVATKDGEHFFEIFRDTEPCGTAKGFQACFETAGGKVIATLSDQRQTSYSKLVAPVQEWI